jgi:hypothetical protein
MTRQAGVRTSVYGIRGTQQARVSGARAGRKRWKARARRQQSSIVVHCCDAFLLNLPPSLPACLPSSQVFAVLAAGYIIEPLLTKVGRWGG